MSKSDQKAVKSQAQNQINTNNAHADATNTQLQSILGNAQSNADSIRPGVVAGFSDISQTGGYDPSILGTINSTFGNLATTGGISDADAGAIRQRATQAAQSTYQTAADKSQRIATATGGYGDTSAAVQKDLARTGSEAASKAAVNADASITGLRQQGEIAGATGLNTTQNNIASNKLAANTGLSNIYGFDENQVNTTVSQILQNYQQTGQLNNQDLTILTNLANQPGIFDKIVSTIGTLGGAAAGVLTGAGALKGAKG